MSETLKFGNGQWAVKKGSTLAYNDEGNNYKPLPFTFDRSTSATRVNKQGLIEVVSNNEPRIDFLNDSKGALLLEPTRTNYSAYSETPSIWTYTEFGSGSAGTITTGKTDMFGGTNAVQIDFPSNADNVGILFGSASSGLSSGDCTISIYVKLVESGSKNLQLRAGFKGIVNVNSTEFTRVDLSGTKTNTEAFNLKLRPSEGTSSGGFSIIVCHPQEEQGSYPTSYIPTQGSVVTRVAEVCNDAGNEQVFNDSEGVLYAEISALTENSGLSRRITISDGSTNNRVSIELDETQGLIKLFLSGNGTLNQLTTTIDVSVNFKIAASYNSSSLKLYVDGVKKAEYTSIVLPNGLNDLSFDSGTGGSNFYGNVKDVRVYNTALTDQELAALTS